MKAIPVPLIPAICVLLGIIPKDAPQKTLKSHGICNITDAKSWKGMFKSSKLKKHSCVSRNPQWRKKKKAIKTKNTQKLSLLSD